MERMLAISKTVKDHAVSIYKKDYGTAIPPTNLQDQKSSKNPFEYNKLENTNMAISIIMECVYLFLL